MYKKNCLECFVFIKSGLLLLVCQCLYLSFNLLTLSTHSILNGIVHVLIWNVPCRPVGVKGLKKLVQNVEFHKGPLFHGVKVKLRMQIIHIYTVERHKSIHLMTRVKH